MNRRAIVLATSLVAVCVFAAAAFLVGRNTGESVATAGPTAFVRPHSPVIGPQSASVTIVEFFDPACEACRAMYPYVKQILSMYPQDVRLVMRYAPLHAGSDEAVRILEAARVQNKFADVLEAMLERQHEWASHGTPNLARAWELAGMAGLDVTLAKQQGFTPEVDKVLEMDGADLRANDVRRTPTFFVNGKPLTSFGPQQLYELVRDEVASTKGS